MGFPEIFYLPRTAPSDHTSPTTPPELRVLLGTVQCPIIGYILKLGLLSNLEYARTVFVNKTRDARMRETRGGRNVSGSCTYLFGVLRRFQHCTGHITTGSWKGRGNQYIEFARVLYCKLPTNGKQLPAFPHRALTGIEPRPQRWEARVLPLCHRGPLGSCTMFCLEFS